MKVLQTELFETVHPMTYMFVLKSIALGLLVIVDALSGTVNVLTHDDLLWPVPLTYVWAVALVLGGCLMIFFFMRDHSDRDRRRIWYTASGNVSLWVFAGTFWFVTVGSQIMIVVSVFNILAFTYIGLASRFSKPFHRV